MSDIFISYKAEDRPRVAALARVLEDAGWDVWWDPDIPAGSQYDEVIEEALERAACVVVVWSPRSVRSQWVRSEAEEGARRRVLVPVLIEKVKIPLAFRYIQSADLINWDGDRTDPRLRRLIADIARFVPLEREPVAPPPVGVPAEGKAPPSVAAPAEGEAPRSVEVPAEGEGPPPVGMPAEGEAPPPVGAPAEGEAPPPVGVPAVGEAPRPVRVPGGDASPPQTERPPYWDRYLAIVRAAARRRAWAATAGAFALAALLWAGAPLGREEAADATTGAAPPAEAEDTAPSAAEPPEEAERDAGPTGADGTDPSPPEPEGPSPGAEGARVAYPSCEPAPRVSLAAGDAAVFAAGGETTAVYVQRLSPTLGGGAMRAALAVLRTRSPWWGSGPLDVDSIEARLAEAGNLADPETHVHIEAFAGQPGLRVPFGEDGQIQVALDDVSRGAALVAVCWR